MRDDEARACDVGVGHCAVGVGVGDVGAGVLLGAAPRDCILEGDSADVQFGRRCGGRGGGQPDAPVVGDREARLLGEAALPVGAGGVDDAVGGGVVVVDPADVDLGIHDHVAGKEKRKSAEGVAADSVRHCRDVWFVMRGDVRIGPESIFCEYYERFGMGGSAVFRCGAGRGGGFPIGLSAKGKKSNNGSLEINHI